MNAFRYRLFGGALFSELPIPGLAVSRSETPTWRFSVGVGPPPDARGEFLGETRVDTWLVRIEAHRTGYRVDCDALGVFDLLDGGADIRWYPGAHRCADCARTHLLGRVIALALHEAGALCLHGGAAAVGTEAVAFVAPKHAGKSTLVHALASAGGGMVSDDLVVVDMLARPRVRSGAPDVRLCRDAAAHFGIDAGAGVREAPGGKLELARQAGTTPTGALPLAAVYRLEPKRTGAGVPPVRRLRIPAAEAVWILASEHKLGGLLDGTRAAVVFERAAALARAVPVFRLEVAHDFSRLADVAAQLVTWHAGSGETGAELRALACAGRPA
jgi:hypothetical protein